MNKHPEPFCTMDKTQGKLEPDGRGPRWKDIYGNGIKEVWLDYHGD
jgi:hypothetical protein